MLVWFYNIIIGRCFHRWGRWEIYAEGKMLDEDEALYGRYRIYQKSCDKCGLGEFKRIVTRGVFDN